MEFGTEIDADLRQVDQAALAGILAAMDRCAVGVFHHATPLTNEEHIAFSARLGPIEVLRDGKRKRIPHPEIVDQSNLDENGEIFPDDDKRMLYKRANRLWHTDMSFHPVRATYSLLSAHVIPPTDADTEFADMRAAYAALPDSTKERIDGLVAEHSYYYSRVVGGGPEPTEEERRARPPAQHALVHEHRGRKVLYLASHASHIVGRPVDEGRALLRELTEFATRPEFIYRHRWRVGDVVMWDNLCTMHRATPFEDQRYKRDMRRTTVREGTVQLEVVL
jgi:alpha-ketoglutarate-dependent 2,4-dichlorophenoxyacetate dioxygenase